MAYDDLATHIFLSSRWGCLDWFWEHVAPKIHKQWMSHFSKASRLTIRHTSGRNDAVPPQVPYSNTIWLFNIAMENHHF
jgi:hypothetical protein